MNKRNIVLNVNFHVVP